jgi:hypothetical protein
MLQPYQMIILMLELGEAPGFTSILDACSPSQQPVARHILISEVPISLSDEDREYLRSKGVFTLPQKSTCNELLRAYFHHVHPIMPVVDASVLLKLHQTGKASEWNLLLLWSMFFVAANVSTCNLTMFLTQRLLTDYGSSLSMPMCGPLRATHRAMR